jgi:hypothetical protein
MKHYDSRRSLLRVRRDVLRAAGTGAAAAFLWACGRRKEATEPTGQGRHKAGLVYYRHGEVTLLFEPKDPRVASENRSMDAAHLRDLRAVVESAGGTLHALPLSGWHGERTLLPIHRGAYGVRVLQTVNLSSWIADPVNEHDYSVLVPSIRDVARVVNGINHRLADGPIEVGDYRLLAASPNWLASPMNGP